MSEKVRARNWCLLLYPEDTTHANAVKLLDGAEAGTQAIEPGMGEAETDFLEAVGIAGVLCVALHQLAGAENLDRDTGSKVVSCH